MSSRSYCRPRAPPRACHEARLASSCPAACTAQRGVTGAVKESRTGAKARFSVSSRIVTECRAISSSLKDVGRAQCDKERPGPDLPSTRIACALPHSLHELTAPNLSGAKKLLQEECRRRHSMSRHAPMRPEQCIPQSCAEVSEQMLRTSQGSKLTLS